MSQNLSFPFLCCQLLLLADHLNQPPETQHLLLDHTQTCSSFNSDELDCIQSARFSSCTSCHTSLGVLHCLGTRLQLNLQIKNPSLRGLNAQAQFLLQGPLLQCRE